MPWSVSRKLASCVRWRVWKKVALENWEPFAPEWDRSWAVSVAWGIALARKKLYLEGEGWKAHGDPVSSWLAFRAAVRHCFDLIYIFVLSNRTRFLSPERNGINSARFFANSVSREEEESYIQMVILCFTLHMLHPNVYSYEFIIKETCTSERFLQSENNHLNVIPGYWEQIYLKLVFFPAGCSSS